MRRDMSSDRDFNNHSIQGFIIDLDGTVYRGKQAIEGASAAIAAIKASGRRLVFLSNRGNISRRECLRRLRDMGVEGICEDEILLSSTVTARFMRSHHPTAQVWVLGDEGFREELLTEEVKVAARPEDADWLLITLHEALTYRELNMAFQAVRRGAGIIATNADKSFPGEEGESIDVAGMIGAIAGATGKHPELVIGKPSSIMAEAALAVLGLPPENCVVVGDSLHSDIRLGRDAGMKTALVLTGSTDRQLAESSEIKPDWVWESIDEAAQLLISDTYKEEDHNDRKQAN